MDAVYIVMADEYSDRHIVAVFKTNEEAEEFEEIYNRGLSDNCDKWGKAWVEKMTFGVNYDFKNEKMFEVYFNTKFEIVEYRPLELVYNDYMINKLPQFHKYRKPWGKDILYRVTLSAIDPNHAKKAAQDILSMWKAEKEEIV